MALRLRRGTDAERLTITPKSGELVYTTDTKQIWVGDGTTVGGVPVTAGALSIGDLGDVSNSSAEKDQILIYNGTQWTPSDNPAVDIRGNIYADDSTLLVDALNGQIVGTIVSDSITATSPIVGDLIGDVTGDVTGNVTGDVVGDTLGIHTGYHNGDMTGSVFAIDSTLMIDANNGQAFFNGITTLDIETEAFEVKPASGDGVLKITNSSAGSLSGTQYSGKLFFGRSDSVGELSTGGMFVGENAFYIAQDNTGQFNTESQYITWTKDGRLGIGTYSPTATLDVRGEVSVVGNVTADAFQGSVIADDSTVVVDAATGAIVNLKFTGEVGNSPATPGTVDSWLEVTVNGATKYIPLYV